MYLVTADEMRAFDRAAIADYGIPSIVLMENAGRSTFQLIQKHIQSELRDSMVSIVAGPGNNGGDGFVIARYLINYGALVYTFLLTPREKIKGDALINLQILEKMTDNIIQLDTKEAVENVSEILKTSDIIVDAILGTGLNSEVGSPFSDVIDEINDSDALKIAVDIPSGIDADTGKILGVAVLADITATYGFMKVGMAVYPGKEFCGYTECIDISIPAMELEKREPKAFYYQEPNFTEYFENRLDPESHKGFFGHLFIIGGSLGKTGAPVMAAQAAAKIGAGLVTVAIPASLNAILETKLTEEMTMPLPDEATGFFSPRNTAKLIEAASERTCVVFGPGISTHKGIDKILFSFLEQYSGAILIDADGLNLLSTRTNILKKAAGTVILTPHPGEMARLINQSAGYVQANRIEVARTFAQEFNVILVLKGAGTITAFPDGTIMINSTGNQWMASGGQGDVLSGIIGGLLAQGIPTETAVPLGIYVHGFAADAIVKQRGSAPVQASDVLAVIPEILASFGPTEPHEHFGEEDSCEVCDHE